MTGLEIPNSCIVLIWAVGRPMAMLLRMLLTNGAYLMSLKKASYEGLARVALESVSEGRSMLPRVSRAETTWLAFAPQPWMEYSPLLTISLKAELR